MSGRLARHLRGHSPLTRHPRWRHHLSRLVGPVTSGLCAILGLVVFCLALAPTAQAQGWGFLGGGGFFGNPPQETVDRPNDRTDRRLRTPRRRPQVVRRHIVEPKETETVAAPKPISPNASHFVAVLGDSLGQRLANGLDDALTDRPDIAVLHKARDSSGFVRADFYDWPKAAADLLAATDSKIDVAVMMIGTNDRQSLSEGGQTYAPLSDEWTALYTRRATALAEVFKKKNVPLIWVGVPITRSDTFAKSMAALNDIYRGVAKTTGATYIDTWEAFSDGQGNFSAVGPDVNGQIVRLRSEDGIHFTKAGDRKLANFVEVAIRRALDKPDAAPVLVNATPELPKKDEPPRPKIAPKPDIGPVILLTAAPVDESGKLAAPNVSRGAAAEPSEKTEARMAPRGRADDMSWPKP